MALKRLIEPGEIGRVSKSATAAIGVAVTTLDTEQSTNAKNKALRLFCRALIRLYLQDRAKTENGKRLGIL
jgi:hypothetical protein